MASVESGGLVSILVETADDMVLSWYVDGTATDVGDVTIGITDLDGNTVVAAGTATTNNNDGTYTYSVGTSLTGNVDFWVVKWTDTSSGHDVTHHVEVVGGRLFTEAEARAFDGSAMTSATDYPDADIRAARDRITDAFEDIAGVSFVPRYRRDVLPGSGTPFMVLGRRRVLNVLAATDTGVSVTVGDITVLTEPSDTIALTSGTWKHPTQTNPENVTVEYRHGYRSVPLDIKRAALTVLRYELVDSNVSDRALSLTNEFGNVRLATPGIAGAWYGLPTVDATLNRRRETAPI